MQRSWRAATDPGDLTAVWVPDEGSEALRDLVRTREAAKQDQLRARHRLSKFLLRSGNLLLRAFPHMTIHDLEALDDARLGQNTLWLHE
ncbi:MAG: transposase [Acidobacteriaceae bacterium]|jgi:transposase|nr:transposase [Acidobacteriaceae bacterium]